MEVQLSSVFLNLGSSNTSCLHRAAEVRPQQNQSHTSELQQQGIQCHFCPGPQDWRPGPLSKKVTVKLTIQHRQAQTDVVPPASALIVTP